MHAFVVVNIMLSVVATFPSTARRLWFCQSRGFDGSIFEDIHRGRVYVHVFVEVSIYAL